jgi:hypothetical protein
MSDLERLVTEHGQQQREIAGLKRQLAEAQNRVRAAERQLAEAKKDGWTCKRCGRYFPRSQSAQFNTHDERGDCKPLDSLISDEELIVALRSIEAMLGTLDQSEAVEESALVERVTIGVAALKEQRDTWVRNASQYAEFNSSLHAQPPGTPKGMRISGLSVYYREQLPPKGPYLLATLVPMGDEVPDAPSTAVLAAATDA